MENNVGQAFLPYLTTKAIWDSTKKKYLDLENTSQLFALTNKARELKWEDLDMTRYFDELTKLWQEMDIFNDNDWRCSEDDTCYRKMEERDRIHDFLAGLNKELNEMRGRCLATIPVPNILVIFSEVRREESRKRVMLGESKTLAPISKGSAFAAHGVQGSNKGDQQWDMRKTGQLFFTPTTIVGGYMSNLQIGERR